MTIEEGGLNDVILKLKPVKWLLAWNGKCWYRKGKSGYKHPGK